MADIQMIEGSWVLDGADKGSFNKRTGSNCLGSWTVPTGLHYLSEKKKKVVDYYWNHLSCIQNFPSVNEIYLQRSVKKEEAFIFHVQMYYSLQD